VGRYGGLGSMAALLETRRMFFFPRVLSHPFSDYCDSPLAGRRRSPGKIPVFFAK